MKSKTIHQQYLGSSDDSDDEVVKVRTGRLQKKKYANQTHIGYDKYLNKIQKKQPISKIDQIIQQNENREWWKTVYDERNNEYVTLTDAQLKLANRLRTNRQAHSFDNEQFYFENNLKDPFPMSAAPPSKRSFQPSKSERIKINKIVQGIKQGRIKLHPELKEEEFIDVWSKYE